MAANQIPRQIFQDPRYKTLSLEDRTEIFNRVVGQDPRWGQISDDEKQIIAKRLIGESPDEGRERRISENLQSASPERRAGAQLALARGTQKPGEQPLTAEDVAPKQPEKGSLAWIKESLSIGNANAAAAEMDQATRVSEKIAKIPGMKIHAALAKMALGLPAAMRTKELNARLPGESVNEWAEGVRRRTPSVRDEGGDGILESVSTPKKFAAAILENAQQMGSTLGPAAVISGATGGGLAGAAVGSLASGALEAMGQAEQTKREGVRRGMTPERAEQAASEAELRDTLINTALNIPEVLAVLPKPAKKAAAEAVKKTVGDLMKGAAKRTGAVLGGTAAQSAQEALQSASSEKALGGEFNPLSKEALKAAVEVAPVSFVAGAGGQVVGARRDARAASEQAAAKKIQDLLEDARRKREEAEESEREAKAAAQISSIDAAEAKATTAAAAKDELAAIRTPEEVAADVVATRPDDHRAGVWANLSKDERLAILRPAATQIYAGLQGVDRLHQQALFRNTYSQTEWDDMPKWARDVVGPAVDPLGRSPIEVAAERGQIDARRPLEEAAGIKQPEPAFIDESLVGGLPATKKAKRTTPAVPGAPLGASVAPRSEGGATVPLPTAETAAGAKPAAAPAAPKPTEWTPTRGDVVKVNGKGLPRIIVGTSPGGRMAFVVPSTNQKAPPKSVPVKDLVPQEVNRADTRGLPTPPAPARAGGTASQQGVGAGFGVVRGPDRLLPGVGAAIEADARKRGVDSKTIRVVSPEDAGVSSGALEATEMLARDLGVNVAFVDTDGPDVPFYGFTTGQTIVVHARSANPTLAVFGHETAHGIQKQRPDLYEPFMELLLSNVNMDGYLAQRPNSSALLRKSVGVDPNAAWADVVAAVQQASGEGKEQFNSFRNEVGADYLGEKVLQPEFWQVMRQKVKDGRYAEAVYELARRVADMMRTMLQKPLSPYLVEKHITPSKLKEVEAAARGVMTEYIAWSKSDTGRAALQASLRETARPGEMMMQPGESGAAPSYQPAEYREATEDEMRSVREHADSIMPPKSDGIRLRQLLGRKAGVGAPVNDRIVIKSKDGKKLVVGKLRPQDWIERVDSTMTPEEVDAARNWYKVALPYFIDKFGVDVAPRELVKWLMSQQNTSPDQGLGYSLAVGEEERGGYRYGKKAGVGDARLRQAQGGDIITSAAEKLHDFLDSALGLKTRRFHNNNPAAGKPYTADVWSKRDAGFIDPEMQNYIRKLFGDEAAAKVAVDKSFAGAPQYEYTSRFGNDLTDWLNRKKWHGGNLEPAEVQAIGWTAMQKFFGLSPQSIPEMFDRNTRRIAFELDWGGGSPYESKYGFVSKLPFDRKMALTIDVSRNLIDIARRELGAAKIDVSFGAGAWSNYPAQPSGQADILSSPHMARALAAALGYSLQQTEMWIGRPSRDQSHRVAVRAIPSADIDTRELWAMIAGKISSVAGGFAPDGNGMRIITNSGGKKAIDRVQSIVIPALKDAGERLGIDLDVSAFRVENEVLRNDWKDAPDGKVHLQVLQRSLPDADRASRLVREFRDAVESGVERFREPSYQPAEPAAPAGDDTRAWHFSRADVRESGIRREFAGTGAAGAERARLRETPEGKVDPESAAVHAYMPGTRPEQNVVRGAQFVNRIESKMRLLRLGTPEAEALVDDVRKANPDSAGLLFSSQVVDEIKRRGYDGMVDEDGELAQIYRDVRPDEIAGAEELTSEDRGDFASGRRPLYQPAEKPPIWFSKLERVLQEKMPNRASADQIRGIIRSGGVKPEEVEWTNLESFLAENPNPTKEQTIQWVRENQIDVQEVTKGDRTDVQRSARRNVANDIRQILRRSMTPETEEKISKWEVDRDYDAEEFLDAKLRPEVRNKIAVMLRDQENELGRLAGSATKFQSYQLPGGKNYRELLLTMKPWPRELVGHFVVDIPGGGKFSTATKAEAEEYVSRWTADHPQSARQPVIRNEGAVSRNASTDFRSSHWDEPNILAHVRFNERLSFDVGSDAVQAEGDKARADSLSRYSKSLSDLVESRAFKAHGAYGLDADAREAMLSGVIGAAGDAEVRRRIVEAIPVNVMNQLVRAERSADDLLSDKAMLSDSLPGNANAPVRFGTDGASVFVRAVARLIAEEQARAAEGIRLPMQRGAAVGAGGVGVSHGGKRTLFIEEIQSDLHQKGRENGYWGGHQPRATIDSSGWTVKSGPEDKYTGQRDTTVRDEHGAVVSQRFNTRATDEEVLRQAVFDRQNDINHPTGAAPDAPFKKTWPELAFKRMLRYAVDNGFDRVAWTTGEQQADRYDLAKQIDALEYTKNDDGTYSLQATKGRGRNRSVLLTENKVQESRLASYVGKSAAEKIVNGEGTTEPGEPDNYKVLRGLDLKVGGEGMRGFYDTMLPETVNKYVKKWGGRVGVGEVDVSPHPGQPGAGWRVWDGDRLVANQSSRANAMSYMRDGYRLEAPGDSPRGTSVHMLDITPAMRESIGSEPQPLYQPVEPIPQSWRIPDLEDDDGPPRFLRVDRRSLLDRFTPIDVGASDPTYIYNGAVWRETMKGRQEKDTVSGDMSKDNQLIYTLRRMADRIVVGDQVFARAGDLHREPGEVISDPDDLVLVAEAGKAPEDVQEQWRNSRRRRDPIETNGGPPQRLVPLYQPYEPHPDNDRIVSELAEKYGTVDRPEKKGSYWLRTDGKYSMVGSHPGTETPWTKENALSWDDNLEMQSKKAVSANLLRNFGPESPRYREALDDLNDYLAEKGNAEKADVVTALNGAGQIRYHLVGEARGRFSAFQLSVRPNAEQIRAIEDEALLGPVNVSYDDPSGTSEYLRFRKGQDGVGDAVRGLFDQPSKKRSMLADFLDNPEYQDVEESTAGIPKKPEAESMFKRLAATSVGRGALYLIRDVGQGAILGPIPEWITKKAGAVGREYAQRVERAKANWIRRRGEWTGELYDAYSKLDFRQKLWAQSNFVEWYEGGQGELPDGINEKGVREFAGAWEDVNSAIANLADELGIQMKRGRSSYLMDFVAHDPKTYVQHILTQKAHDQIMDRKGEIWDALLKHGKKVNLRPEQLWELVNRPTAAKRSGSLEHARVADLPYWVEGKDGKRYQVLRNGLDVLGSHIDEAARRMAVIEQFGQAGVAKELEGVAEQISRSDGIPLRVAQEMVGTTFRRLQGSRDSELMLQHPWLKKFTRAIEAGTAAFQLSAAVIPNLIGGPLPLLIRDPNLKRVGEGFVKAYVDYWRKDPEMAELAALSGASYDIQRALHGKSLMSDLPQGEKLEGRLLKAAGVLPRLTGFNLVNNKINLAVAYAASRRLDAMLDNIRSGNDGALKRFWGTDAKSGERYLQDEWGFSKDDVERMVREGVTKEDRARALQREIEMVNAMNESPMTRPPGLDTPFMRLLLMYTTYVRKFARTAEYAAKEAARGDVRPLLTMFAAGAITGEMIKAARDWLKDRKREDKENYLQRLIGDMAEIGAFGIWGNLEYGIRHFGEGGGSKLKQWSEFVGNVLSPPPVSFITGLLAGVSQAAGEGKLLPLWETFAMKQAPLAAMAEAQYEKFSGDQEAIVEKLQWMVYKNDGKTKDGKRYKALQPRPGREATAYMLLQRWQKNGGTREQLKRRLKEDRED